MAASQKDYDVAFIQNNRISDLPVVIINVRPERTVYDDQNFLCFFNLSGLFFVLMGQDYFPLFVPVGSKLNIIFIAAKKAAAPGKCLIRRDVNGQ